MDYRSSLLNKLQQQAANAATPAVEETPATVITETLSPEMVIETPPAPTPVVAKVPVATPVVAKPQPEPQPQPKETASYRKPETGKKVLPKTMKDLKDLKDLKTVMDLPMVGLIKIAEYTTYNDTVVINSMIASTESGRKNVVTIDANVAGQIVRILEKGLTAFVQIVTKGDINIVTQVIAETDSTTIEGKFFTGIQQVNQWIINQMIQSKIEINENTLKSAMNMLMIVNTGNGLVVLNKNTAYTAITASTTATIAPAATSVTGVTATATGK